MARGLKYQLDFKSLRNKDCQVLVYVEGYTGTAVTQLTGTANPFEYEEDNDTDLLHFVRFRTGYLRVREETFGELDGLQPTTITSHYVVAKYDGLIIFTGYIQCQEFSNSWEAAPRELEFPVISPLGLLESFNFTAPTSGNAPTLTTIGALMKEIMDTLNPYVSGDDTQPGWQGVVFPSTSQAPTYPMSGLIKEIAVTPFNESFEVRSPDTDLYEPVDFLSFIEGFVTSRGWMIHDDPTNILFTQYESYQSNYHISVANLVESQVYDVWGTSAANAEDLTGTYGKYVYSDDDADMNVVPPLKKLTMKIQDKADGAKLPTEYMSVPNILTAGWNTGTTSDGKIFKILVMNAVGPIVSSPYMKAFGSSARFFASGIHVKCDTNGVYPLSLNIINKDATSFGYSQGWYIIYDAPNWDGNDIFQYTAFDAVQRYGGSLILKIALEICERGAQSLDALKSSGWSRDLNVGITLRSGNLYYNPELSPTYRWNVNPAGFNVIFDKDTGKMTPNSDYTDVDDWDGYVFPAPPSVEYPIEVYLSFNAGGTDAIVNRDCIKISSISISNPLKNSEKFRSTDNTKFVRKGTNKGEGESSLDITYNDWLEAADSNLKYTTSSGSGGSPLQFAYMFKTQTFLTARFKMKPSVTPAASWNPLLARFKYEKGESYKWRIISDSFNLADDIHQFVLAHTDGL